MGLMQKREFSAGGKQIRAAIAGFDVEGKATYEYLCRQPNVEITVLDEKDIEVPDGISKQTGPDVFEGELEFDQIWRTPGLNPGKIKTPGEVTSGTIEFFKRCPAKIIGVTGSKGKGTTASLIAEILRKSGQTVHLLGNIGRPALSALPQIKDQDIVAFELSSFQLWDLKQSPHIAVVLMMEPDHLDVHESLEDYLKAKSNIARWQGPDDVTVYLAENDMTAKVAGVGIGKKIAVPGEGAAKITDGQLMIEGQTILSSSDFGLIGGHNHGNIAAALTAAWQVAQDKPAAAEAIREFKGLPHRLQLVASKDGVNFIDDSISTTPTSAIAALRSFEGPKVIILGGSDKGVDFKRLASNLAGQNETKAVIIGQTASKIISALDEVGFKDYKRVAGGMMEIVRDAVEMLGGNGTVLLSPACASFDMFKDYEDRADKFIKCVKDL